ncbi:hypothetical protein F7734_13760 [Scytonema sp. UIC 10036]|nr:hypothetical protein [Scytonema sp. UIC 10036]
MTAIANRFHLFECVECAAAIQKFLIMQKNSCLTYTI